MTTENITEPTDNQGVKSTVKFNLICKSKVKQYALEFAKSNRAQKFSRVGEEFLISCEAALKSHIQNRVKSHPSKGKTLT